jgi:putative transposase
MVTLIMTCSSPENDRCPDLPTGPSSVANYTTSGDLRKSNISWPGTQRIVVSSRALRSVNTSLGTSPDLTLRALKKALQQRQPGPGLLHHSDQGSQYTNGRYQALLAARSIEPSMNAAGTWYDNAPMESFFGTLKSERVHHIVYRSRDEAATDLFYYIEGWYNRHRLHSALAYESPEAVEQLYRAQHEVGLTPCPQK